MIYTILRSSILNLASVLILDLIQAQKQLKQQPGILYYSLATSLHKLVKLENGLSQTKTLIFSF